MRKKFETSERLSKMDELTTEKMNHVYGGSEPNDSTSTDTTAIKKLDSKRSGRNKAS